MYTVSLIDYNSTPTGVTPTPSKEELYIYDPRIYDEGLCITDPVLTLTASQAGSFTCKLPITNYGHNKIIKKLTRLIVRKDNKIIFMGRINSDSKDLYLNDEIKAEGALAYLNDSLTGKRVFTPSNNESSTSSSLFDILSYIFTHHNSKFPDEPWKQFTLVTTGDIYGPNDECKAKFVGKNSTDVNSTEISYYSVNYFTSMESVSELLSLANAVLKIEYNVSSGKWDIYIFKQYVLPKCSQTIEFGENLIDLVQSYDDTDICSSVAPFGGDAIQESKEIGEVIAGITNQYILLTSEPSNWSTNYTDYYVKVQNQQTGDYEYQNVPSAAEVPEFAQDTYYRYEADPNHIFNHVLIREPDTYNYGIWDAPSGWDGYWAFEFDIEAYNATQTEDHKLKRLYVSWRGYKFDVPSGWIADNAWRVVSRIDGTDQSLGYHELTSGSFVGEVNEVIDLTDAKYARATHILMGGWGGLITPTIRRDAIIVEENEKVNICKCDTIDPDTDEDGLGHDANSPYLYSKPYINSFGLIEKKLEYEIEDSLKPIYPFSHPYAGPLGGSAIYSGRALGYEVPHDSNNDTYDYDTYKGLYNLIIFPAQQPSTAYTCIEYELPSLGNPNRPRGVFITSRMHQYGLYYDSNTQKYWQIDGIYCFLDESHQVLAYKAASADDKGVGFTNLKREYIDLSDGQYYGTKYIRVGGYTGDGYGLELTPSDDAYARNRLLDQARLYLTSQQWEKATIEATAVDLSMTGSEWERFDICTLADVYSTIHGLASTLPITSLEIHLDELEDNSIRLGYDSDEYLSAQLSENLRIMSIEQAIEEKRRDKS